MLTWLINPLPEILQLHSRVIANQLTPTISCAARRRGEVFEFWKKSGMTVLAFSFYRYPTVYDYPNSSAFLLPRSVLFQLFQTNHKYIKNIHLIHEYEAYTVRECSLIRKHFCKNWTTSSFPSKQSFGFS